MRTRKGGKRERMLQMRELGEGGQSRTEQSTKRERERPIDRGVYGAGGWASEGCGAQPGSQGVGVGVALPVTSDEGRYGVRWTT